MSEKIEREIYKGKIPDDDMIGWIQSLREGGLTDKEIDEMLSKLNKTYAEKKGLNPVDKRK